MIRKSSAKSRVRPTSAPDGVQRERVAVEDELVVAADLVQVDERPPMLDGLLPDHVTAQRGLAHRERARRDVDEQVDAGGREIRNRIARIQLPRPERRVVPDFLADRHTETHALERHRRSSARAGLEVAVFVEDVVRRQQRLRVARDDAALVAENGSVEERLAAARGVALDAPDENPQRVIRERCDAIALREVGVDEAAVIQQVARRVARRGQLRENQQVGARLAGAACRVGDLEEVGLERADREIQLGEGEAHVQLSIVPRA